MAEHISKRGHKPIYAEFSVDYWSHRKTPVEKMTDYARKVFAEYNLETLGDYDAFESEVYDYLEQHGDWNDIRGSVFTAHLSVLKDWLNEKEPELNAEIRSCPMSYDFEADKALFINGEKFNDNLCRFDMCYNYKAYTQDGKGTVSFDNINTIDRLIRDTKNKLQGKYDIVYSDEFLDLTEDDMHTVYTQKQFQDIFSKFENNGGNIITVSGKGKTTEINIKDFVERPELIDEYRTVDKMADYILDKLKKAEKTKKNVIKE